MALSRVRGWVAMLAGQREMWLALLVVASPSIQAFHMVEELAQVTQKYVYGVHPHGIPTEAFGREWFQFGYKPVLEAILGSGA